MKLTPDGKRDWNYYKDRIDFVDYAEQQGYEINSRKTSRSYVVMHHTTSQEVIIIYKNKNTGYQGYFNPNDSRDEGSVVDFQKFRSNGDWKEVFAKLDGYLNELPTNYNPKVKIEPVGTVNREQAIQHEFRFLPLTDAKYLNDRGLTNETIFSPEFQHRIYNKHFYENQRTHVNIAFPLKNETGTIAAIIRNDAYNKIEEPKMDASWISNTKYKDGQTDRLVISESPIDSLSFHQLMKPKTDEKRVYLATAGNLSETQPRFIQLAIDTLKPRQIILANDNDNAGIKQNLNLIGTLSHPDSEQSQYIKTHLNLIQNTHALLLLKVSHPNQEEGAKLLEHLSNKLTEDINKHTPSGLEPDAKAVVTQHAKFGSELEIHFTNNRQNLIRVEKSLLEVKNLDRFITVKRPVNKDFNEDLKSYEKHRLEPISDSKKEEKLIENQEVKSLKIGR
jgi:hypothetical protein